MGNLANAYKKKVLEAEAFKAKPEPDRVNEPQAYFEYHKEKRFAENGAKQCREFLGKAPEKD